MSVLIRQLKLQSLTQIVNYLGKAPMQNINGTHLF